MAPWLVIMALTFPSVAVAQEGTIEQLVATALDRSPDIRAARTAITAAGGQLTQAGLRPNPMVSASRMLMTGEQHQTLVEVDWPLDLFRRPARIVTAQHAVEATTLSVQDRERLLAATVRALAGRLLAARRNVEIMSEALTAARRMRELLDSRVTEGELPKLDANIAAVEAGRIEADLTLAQAEAEGAAIELKAVAGLGPNDPLVLRESLEGLVGGTPAPASLVSFDPSAPPAPPAPPASTGVSAIAARADVREATARVALADAKLEQARREGRADLTLTGNYGREGYGFAQRGFDSAGRLVPVQGSFHSFEIGARLMLPLRNRNQGAIAVAEAERIGEQEWLAARQLAAQAEIDAAVVRDREALRAVDMYATSIRDLARQNVDVQLEAYDLGRTPLSDLLAEQRRYLDVESAYTAVLARAYDARVTLRRARGEIR
ncbi:MAG TPA: TolC family protein [Vicinamibacterales bacterium]|nr:TolC family protein [Vicinamibacterales bacterium]